MVFSREAYDFYEELLAYEDKKNVIHTPQETFVAFSWSSLRLYDVFYFAKKQSRVIIIFASRNL